MIEIRILKKFYTVPQVALESTNCFITVLQIFLTYYLPEIMNEFLRSGALFVIEVSFFIRFLSVFQAQCGSIKNSMVMIIFLDLSDNILQK